MKVALTGHTSGIGAHLFHILKISNFDVHGFSRSNDWDLNDYGRVRDFSWFITKYNDFDIFINNAYVGPNNIILLNNVFNKWRGMKDKMIINISSNSGDSLQRSAPHEYSIWKRAVDNACLAIHSMEHKCRVINFKFGYVDTPRVEHIDKPKLTIEQVVDKIIWAMYLPDNIYLQEIKFVTRTD